MFRKVNYGVLGFILFLSGLFLYGFGYTHAAPGPLNAAEVATPPAVAPDSTVRGSRPSELKLAAWNIRILSDRSRDDAEVKQNCTNAH